MGNFTKVCRPEGPGSDEEEHRSRLTTLVVAFCSAFVGGDVSGRDVIWPTVNFDGENVGRACLQPESTCAFKFLRATTWVHVDTSHARRRSPRTFITTADALG